MVTSATPRNFSYLAMNIPSYSGNSFENYPEQTDRQTKLFKTDSCNFHLSIILARFKVSMQ